MEGIFQFFQTIAANYGTTFAIVFLLLVILLYGLYLIVKTFPDVIRTYLENKINENKAAHVHGTIKRKNISNRSEDR